MIYHVLCVRSVWFLFFGISLALATQFSHLNSRLPAHCRHRCDPRLFTIVASRRFNFFFHPWCIVLTSNATWEKALRLPVGGTFVYLRGWKHGPVGMSVMSFCVKSTMQRKYARAKKLLLPFNFKWGAMRRQHCSLLTTSLSTGSGRVFSGSGIWPKYGAGFGKTQNFLMGFGIWLLPGKRDSPKFGHGMGDFLVCLSGIRESVTTQVNVLAAKANQPGERKISIKWANLHLEFISFCRN